MALRLILGLWFVVGACSGLFAPDALAIDDGILAVVDTEVITAKDVQDYLRGIYSQLRLEGRPKSEIAQIMGQYETRGVEQLVEDRLILAEANRQGMTIRSRAIDERMEEIKARYASPQEFLKEINKEGVTISDIRKKIEDQFKAQYVVDKDVRDKIYVNPQDVTAYYNAHLQDYRRKARVYLQSIVVKGSKFDQEARKKAGEALARVKRGEDFQAVAKECSDLPYIGEVEEESLGPAFKAAVDKMQVGGLSDVVSTGEGFYILKLTGRMPAGEPLLNDVKEEIYQSLFEEKFKVAFKAWLEKLRKKSYVEIRQ